jgi:putative transposase
MIDRSHSLPVTRQAQTLGISRGSVYYRPRPVGEAGLALMRRIDQLHMEHPFAGSRMMRGLLRLDGVTVGRRHLATLMRRMGIEALYRKPNTSRRHPGHAVYPYLLRGLAVTRANQSVGHGHHVHTYGAGLRVPGRSGGLAQPQGAGLAGIHHDGH